MPLQLEGTEFNLVAGGPVVQILRSNPRRVYVIFQQFSGAGNCNLCIKADGLVASAIDDLNQSLGGQWRRHDWGELVTGEWYAANGAGFSPTCDFSMLEATLV